LLSYIAWSNCYNSPDASDPLRHDALGLGTNLSDLSRSRGAIPETRKLGDELLLRPAFDCSFAAPLAHQLDSFFDTRTYPHAYQKASSQHSRPVTKCGGSNEQCAARRHSTKNAGSDSREHQKKKKKKKTDAGREEMRDAW
jgi:hypothetical protein